MFLSKKHTAIFVIFTLLFSSVITGCKAQDKENNNSVNQTATSKQENSAENLDQIKDSDLDLSIEELRKKYPIDWMEEKYGVVNPKDCDDGDDEPWLAEAVSWPCGPVCKKYPNVKNCPKKCHPRQKSSQKNLICSFFKESSELLVDYGETQKDWVDKPVASIKDFSISEIKSAFLYYFLSETKDCNSIFEGDCKRAGEISAITFIHFFNTDEKNLNDEMKKLKTFVFSQKISDFTDVYRKSPISCESFAKIYIRPSVKPDQYQSFCSNLLSTQTK